MQLPLFLNDVAIPDGLPSWLVAFVSGALRENETLTENGAHHAVSARIALLNRLMCAASTYLDSEVDIETAAALTRRHPETIRRAVRAGILADHRPNPRGRHHIRRGDLDKLAAPKAARYDAVADAQDIARRRRPL